MFPYYNLKNELKFVIIQDCHIYSYIKLEKTSLRHKIKFINKQIQCNSNSWCILLYQKLALDISEVKSLMILMCSLFLFLRDPMTFSEVIYICHYFFFLFQNNTVTLGCIQFCKSISYLNNFTMKSMKFSHFFKKLY